MIRCTLFATLLALAPVAAQDAAGPVVPDHARAEPEPIDLPEVPVVQTTVPFTEGLLGRDLKAQIENAVAAALTQSEGEDFPTDYRDGQVVRVTNPAGASPGVYRRQNGAWVALWRESPYVIVPVQVIDTDLVIWNTALPTAPGSDIYNIADASYFELMPTTARTVTLCDAGATSAQKPLVFVNHGVGAGATITFQKQVFPGGNDDKFSPFNADIDLVLYPGEMIVLTGDAGVLGRWQILHETRNPIIEIDHNDSPFTMKWWHRKVLADASGGAVTVELPDAESASPHPGQVYDYSVMNIGPSGSVTVQPQSGNVNGGASVSLASQWDAGTFHSDGTDYFQF